MEGTDESVYIIIFSNRNFVHLNEVANLYKTTYGVELSTVVTIEFANEMGSALVSIRKSWFKIFKMFIVETIELRITLN
jgi:annexin A7/11